MADLPYDPAKPLVFMHVPKCGGTSLDLALQRALGFSESKRFFGTVLHGDPGRESYNSWNSEALDHVAFDSTCFVEDAGYVVAHASFAELHQRHPDGQFVTVFREPISRLISLRTYLRGFDDQFVSHFGNYGMAMVRARLSLKEFLSHPFFAAGYDNVAVRMLLHGDPRIPSNDFISPEHDSELIRAALQQLERFQFVSAVERTALSKELEAYLRRDFVMEKDNESSTVPPHLKCDLETELDDDTFNLLASHSRLDFQLWKAAMRIEDQPDALSLQTRLVARCVSRHSRILLGT